MCFIITGTLPKDVDLDEARGVEGPEGRAWEPVENPHVARQLSQTLGYFRVTGSWCDCDSGLSRCARRRSRRQHWPKAAKRWSETKRRRWLEQRDGKAGPVRGDVVAWRGYVVRLARLASGPVGLLVHWYRGGIEDEAFTIDIRAPARLSTVTPGDFAAFDEDVLYQFVSG